MCPSLVEIRSVTSEIMGVKKKEEERRKKERRKTTAVKYKPFSIVMPCRLIIVFNHGFSQLVSGCESQ